MNDDATRLRDDYLDRLRRALRGVSRDTSAEIEREIAAHVEDALAARPERDVGALLDVLERLGPPEAYAPDLGLYMMVDRGYRSWSVRHMVGSARFWALSTAVGATVVLIFGAMYATALAISAAGLLRLASDAFGAGRLPAPLEAVPTTALLIGGPVALAAITVHLRWFIGQYVRRARPGPWADDDDADWSERAARLVVVFALAGLVLLAAAGLLAGAISLEHGALVLRLRPPSAPLSLEGLVGILGLLVYFLSPVLGILAAARTARPGGA